MEISKNNTVLMECCNGLISPIVKKKGCAIEVVWKCDTCRTILCQTMVIDNKKAIRIF